MQADREHRQHSGRIAWAGWAGCGHMRAPHSASAGGPRRRGRRRGRRPRARCRPKPPPRRQPQCGSARPFCWVCGRPTAARLHVCIAASACAVYTLLIGACNPRSTTACMHDESRVYGLVSTYGGVSVHARDVTMMHAVQTRAVWASWQQAASLTLSCLGQNGARVTHVRHDDGAANNHSSHCSAPIVPVAA